MGILAGLVMICDAAFHIYVAVKRPDLRRLMKEQDTARREGTSTGDDSGIVTRMANMAVEDPNKFKQMGQAGANLAATNPGMASMALGMAAGGGASAFGAPASMPAPAPTPAPAAFAPAPATAGADFQVDDYDLGSADGTAI